MKTYPGLPEPAVEVIFDYDQSHERYQGKAEFRIASLDLCGNTGTYVDAPIHRYRGGADLASLPLDRLADLVCRLLLENKDGRTIGPDAFRETELSGRAALVRTDFSRNWGTDAYFSG